MSYPTEWGEVAPGRHETINKTGLANPPLKYGAVANLNQVTGLWEWTVFRNGADWFKPLTVGEEFTLDWAKRAAYKAMAAEQEARRTE